MTPPVHNTAETIPVRPSVWPGFPPGGIVALMLGIFAACTILVILLRNKRTASTRLAFILALVLLIFNSVYFGINRGRRGWYPVEFSHISYFVMAVSVVMGSKKLLGLAGYCSMLTGLGYVLAGVISPVSLLTTSFSAVELAISIVRHEAMWLCGWLIFFNVGRLRMRDVWIAVLGVGMMIGFSLLVYYGLVYPGFAEEERETMQIITIVQGNILEYVTHKPLPMAARIATSAGIGVAVVGTLVLYYLLNTRINAAREKKRMKLGGYYENPQIGILPFLIKALKYKGITFKARKSAAREKYYNCVGL